MSKLTKVELVAINARLAAENAALRAELSRTKIDLQAMAGCTAKLASTPRPDVTQRHEAMQAARALAMTTGRMIKV